MAEKRYYWLKLKEDYFNNPKIKKLRRVAGGDTFTIIYLKMQLLSVSNKGIIEYESIEPTFEEELALKLDEDVEDVKLTLAYLSAQNLIENNENEFMLIEASKNIGSEVDSAERVRQFREREKQKALQCNDCVTPVLQNSISISNSISKSNNKDIDNILNNIEDEKLKETLIEFVKMRKSIKKPMTTHALELLIKKLNRITTDVGVQIQMLEQSILNGWQDVYELKQEVKQNNFIHNKYTKEQISSLITDLDNWEV